MPGRLQIYLTFLRVENCIDPDQYQQPAPPTRYELDPFPLCEANDVYMRRQLTHSLAGSL